MPLAAHVVPVARRILLPLFQKYNPGDVTIKNPRTGDPLRLHSFRHKGYWFHGRRREARSMELFEELIGPGDHVAEVGGHIGYISQWFAHLVGESGSVTVFEPGPNNLPYLTANTRDLPQVVLVSRAVGDQPGQATLMVEDLTGQNNSLVRGFNGLAENAEAAGIHARVESVLVEVTTLDEHFTRPPDFIKIDVEGYELPVLRGARRMLAGTRPLLMVEIQADQDAIQRLASDLGYAVLDEALDEVTWEGSWSGNSFWFHHEQHAALLAGLRDKKRRTPQAAPRRRLAQRP